MFNIETNNIFKEIKVRDTHLKVVDSVEKAKQGSDTKKEFFKEIAKQLQNLTKSHSCFIVFPNEQRIISEIDFQDIELLLKIGNDSLNSAKPTIINDTFMHKKLRKQKIKNLLAFADIKDQYVIILANKPRPFNNFDCFLLSLTIKSIQNQIPFIDLKQELILKQKELDIIDHINKIKSTIKNLDIIIETIINDLIKTIPSEAVIFIMNRGNKSENHLRVAGKHPKSQFIRDNIQIIDKIVSHTINKAEITKFSNLNSDIKNALCAPFLLTEKDLGVFCLLNSKNKEGYTKSDTTLLNTISRQIGYAVFEDLEKTELKRTFERYVAPEVIETMLKDSDKDYMKTQKKEITVLFSDLRGFTALSEKLPAEKIVEILNEHFETMTNIILKHKGTIDKFIGDGIMAIFGAPIYYESHALRAIKVAIEMQEAQKNLSKNLEKQGIKVNIGVGINTGEVIIGNIGSSKRTDYTVIGDTVNVASRLCGNASANEIIVSDSTYREVGKSVKFTKKLYLKLKGKSKKSYAYIVKELINNN